MSKHEEFLQTHVSDGRLAPEQAAQFLELAEEGDTGAHAPESGGTPDATPEAAAAGTDVQGKTNDEPKADGAQAPAADPANPDPEKTVVLAKDGVHTIPYQKLVEAREDGQAWKAKAEAVQQQLETLQAAAQQRADAGVAPTAADTNLAAAEKAIAAGVDVAVFGDFSEEAIAKGIQHVISSATTTLRAELKAELLREVKAELQPIHEQQAKSSLETHFETIYSKHPDADSIAESAEMQAWIKAQPTFTQAGYQAVLKQGTATEVIELMDVFKAATGTTQTATAPASADVKAAAKAAIAASAAAVPNSITDIPGGHVGPANRFEAMAAMDGPALTAAMESMTSDQIEAFLNRRM